MSKIAKTSNYISVGIKDDGNIDKPQFQNYLQYVSLLDGDIKKMVLCLQGRVDFGASGNLKAGENIFGQWVTVSDTGTANTEFTVPHSLQSQSIGIIPGNYFVTHINKGGVVYDSGTTWTTSNIYLKCSTANTTLTLFLTR